MSLLVLSKNGWKDWMIPVPAPYFLRERKDSSERCPWCSSPAQYTDFRGTCCQCHLPWDHRDWWPCDFDQAETG